MVNDGEEKKKRGRKPKIDKIPKKRGRKPKQDLYTVSENSNEKQTKQKKQDRKSDE